MANGQFELPKNIDRCLGTLSKVYAKEGNRQLQEIIVNAQVRVREGWSYDNWNGGTHGHAIFLMIPEIIFLPIAKQRDEIQEQLAKDINNIHNVQNEYVEHVFLEMEIGENSEWRQESGLLLSQIREVSPQSARRVWGEKGFRVFLSHKSEVKKETAFLKERLRIFGVSAFVAHEDIHPTKAWQDEIENALATMDGFVALITAGFHQSDWTDQEVGYAFALGVPIIAVRLEQDPYGFLGKFQALTSSWDTCAQDIVKLLIKHDRMFSSFVQAIQDCTSFDNGNALSRILPEIETLTPEQIDELVAAYNANGEVRGSFGFSGTKSTWGPGLLPHLHRLGTRRFTMAPNWPRLIELEGQVHISPDEEIPF